MPFEGKDAPRPPAADPIDAERIVLLFCLAAGSALAWWWLLRQGGAPAARAMAGMEGMAAPEPLLAPHYLAAAFAMWALMMIAMMLPSASPMIALYARFAAKSGSSLLPSLVVACTYLAVWAIFSAAAALAQALLVGSGAVSAMTLSLGSRTLAAGLLFAAALYELSPLKRACLDQCRSPFSFLLRLWRPGIGGAVRIGVAHGVYCVGCCWSLMALLFVGGVMNPAWVAALALIVALEKLVPARLHVEKFVAGTLAAAAVIILLS
ncbi:MAG: DUF2182 domain-containing protein [Sphingomonadales bacterium]